MKNSRLLILLLALLTFGQAKAQGLSGSGTTQDPYLITNNADWITFAQSVADGTTYEGQTVKLTADIAANVMAGSHTSETDYHAFSGTFDGDGHTITLALSGIGHGTALFYHLGDATLKNLKVQGNVTTIGYRPATFASIINGNSTISNCWSTVAVSSSRANDWVDGGGFVGRVSTGASLNMTDCAFHGSVTFAPDATTGGGMVGYTQSNATVNLTNCLYSPTALTLDVSQYNPRVFVSGQVSGNLDNCYYNAVAKASVLTNQGIDASEMTNEALAAALGLSWTITDGLVVPSTTNQYYISSAAMWNAFATALSNGMSFSGRTVTLTADIPTAEEIANGTTAVTTMAGTEATSFAGIFDGQGHTLTVSIESNAQSIAPFRFADGATFKNLKIDGTVNTSNKFAAGMLAETKNHSCSFINCISNVTLTSSVSGDGTHGGFVSYLHTGNTTFEGCAFTGKLLGVSTTHSGGFVGFTDGRYNASVTFTNCVFHPQQVTMSGTSSQTFARWYNNNSGNVTIGNNCYYSEAFGNAQGKQMRSITGGEDVTVAFNGEATPYELSGIGAYSVGIVYDSTLYAGNGETVSLNLSCTPPSGYTFIGYTATAGTLTGSANPYTLTMPNEAVTIQAVLEQSATPVAYIDENGVEQQCTSYTVVTDTLNFGNLPAGWYVVSDSITLNRQVHFSGDAHLILCDGATMNIVDESTPELSIDPTEISEELGEDDMTSVEITINNNGNSIADWAGWLDFGDSGTTGTQTADLYYYNGEVNVSLGSSDAYTHEMGIRLPATAYSGTAMGMRITSAQYYINDYYQSADNNYIFRIYGQGLNNQPGELLAEKTVYSTDAGQWITATFDEEVFMTGQAMWATVQLEQAAGEYPLSMDGGEYGEESDGNWISTNGESFYHCYSAGSFGGAWLITVNCQGTLIPATWATIDKTEGAIMGGQSETITLTLNSIGLDMGASYNANLVINTNDENLPHVEIPVLLNVSDGVGRTVNQLASVYPTPANSMVTLGRSNTSSSNALEADGSLTLYGQSSGTGSLTATSAYLGHGINATNLTINGGTVTATGNLSGIYIGGYVTINGGTVTTNEIYSPTVTLGWSNSTDSIIVGNFTYWNAPTVSVKSRQAFYYEDDGETVIISGTLSSEAITAISGKTLAPYTFDPVAYIDENGEEQQCTFYTIVTNNLNLDNLPAGWYVVNDSITLDNRQVRFTGDAHLILCDYVTMGIGYDADYALYADSSLTLYGQSAGTGNLTSNTNINYGIYATDLNINGCTVTYTSEGPGIRATNLTINGSNVTASGSYGIIATNLTINGSNVTASGDYDGIGALRVTINSGTVTATSSLFGIDATYLTINGGTVTTNSIYSPMVTLGWSNLNDSITVSIFDYYEPHTFRVKSGQAFYYQNGNDIVVVSGTLNEDQINAIGGKTLFPYLPPVPYIDENGEEQECTYYSFVTDNLDFDDLPYGWYVVSESITLNSHVSYFGDAHLILCDGASMNISCDNGHALNTFGSLTLYGQSEGTGSFTATSTDDNGWFSGINANDLTINGGTVTATGSDGYGITAYDMLTINGGTVNATGNNSGIKIENASGYVTINGGTVTATGTYGIYSPRVTLGWSNLNDRITVGNFAYDSTPTVSVKSGQAFCYIDEDSGETVIISGTLTTEEIAAISGKTLVPYSLTPVPYIDENGVQQECTYYTVVTDDLNFDDLPAGWYVVNSNITLNRQVHLTGDAHLILCDGKTMNISFDVDALRADSSLTLYGQSGGTGSLTATSDFDHGINATNLTINGCTVTATGSNSGISADDLTINGSTVTATGSHDGIYADNLTINGSTVMASGSEYFGISADNQTINNSTVTATGSSIGIYAWDLIINGSFVTATGNDYGISAVSVTINSGTVNATGNLSGIYIGNASGYVTINGGTVTTNEIKSPTVTLGWSNTNDSITVGNFDWWSTFTVSVKSGQAFYYIDNEDKHVINTAVISGTLTSGEIAAIAGKTLRPYVVARTVAGFGQGNGGWALIASPFDETNPLNVTNMLSGNHDLYAFVPNPSDDLEWRNYATDTFNLEAGKGYLYANADTVTLTFNGTPYSGNGEFALVYDSTDARKCWNLVGNPFPCAAYLDRPYYLLDADGTGIDPEPIPASVPVPPCTAVFVKAVGVNDTAVFSVTAP